jgi:hypothetical protein
MACKIYHRRDFELARLSTCFTLTWLAGVLFGPANAVRALKPGANHGRLLPGLGNEIGLDMIVYQKGGRIPPLATAVRES